MTTAWANLPNAAHIDRVLADLKARPEAWDAARDAAWGAAWDAARDAAWGTARGTIIALIAWDDCAYLLNFTPDQLKAHIKLTNDPAATLLLPAVTALAGA